MVAEEEKNPLRMVKEKLKSWKISGCYLRKNNSKVQMLFILKVCCGESTIVFRFAVAICTMKKNHSVSSKMQKRIMSFHSLL